jgi:branched-subunit amino acid aminotransferase/4-amino-4-deoxychorismate lyase
MIPYAWINGDFAPLEKAYIPLSDPGFQWGHGVFTTLRLQDGALQNWRGHLERLCAHAKTLEIRATADFEQPLADLIQRAEAETGTWRLKAYLTDGGLKVLSIDGIPAGPERLRLRRFPHAPSHILSSLKSMAYVERLWMRRWALREGADEALITTASGHVLETSMSCVFVRHGTRAYFAPPGPFLLPSLTARSLQELFPSLGVQVHLMDWQVPDMPDDARWYVCNSLRGVLAVLSLDERPLAVDEGELRVMNEALNRRLQRTAFRPLAPQCL